jgi:cytochrome c oxidase subunit IV
MAEHIVERKTYLLIFGALLVLTGLTIWVANLDLGPLNTIVAVAIAVTKAVLVTLYFMHVRYSSRLMQMVVVGGMFFLGVLFALTLGDYLTRGWVSLTR